MYIYAEAVARAKSTDTDPVIKELEKTSYVGIPGAIEFDETHDVKPGSATFKGPALLLAQWRDGCKREVIYPKEMRTADFGGNHLIGVLTVSVSYGIWAVAWDFMSGHTGRENFGHSLFIGVGAYTAGFMNTSFGFNGWWSLPAGMPIAVLFALLIGLPTLRLKGPYFALGMLSSAVIMQRLMLIFWEHTGGEEGINGLTPLIQSQLGFYYFALGALVAITALLLALARSHWGPILRAIRGDEATCQAASINVTFYKIASLVISAAFAGAGGAMYAQRRRQEHAAQSRFALAGVDRQATTSGRPTSESAELRYSAAALALSTDSANSTHGA